MAEIIAKYITQSEAEKVMDKDVLEQFNLVNWSKKRASVRFLHAKYGEIDLRTLSLERAKQLVKLGFPFLEEKLKKSK